MEIPKLPDSLRTEEEIIACWKGDITKPLVSVRCMTYNHAPYIEDAIKGFLIQETNFPIEVWIHDDASTDGTREIVESYQKEYPDIIKTVLQEENQYSKGNKPGKILVEKCKGKYIAVCEGDDFWLDPKKLQVQVDFLESNADYVISGHDAFIINETGLVLKDSKLPDSQKRDFTCEEIAKGQAWILTMSWVYRNILSEYAPERNMVRNGDFFFTSLLGEFGGSHYHSDIIPAAYRSHSGGVWSALSSNQKLDEKTNTLFWMYRYYKRVERPDLEKVFYLRFQEKVIYRASCFYLLKAFMSKLIRAHSLKLWLKEALGPRRISKIKQIVFPGLKKIY